MAINRFEDIESWKLARELTNRLYTIARSTDLGRDFGLRDQILRAAGSVMHNIAEGFDSGGNKEFVRFLQYAKRSCTEVQSQLYLALDQDYIHSGEFDSLYELTAKTRSKIGAFINYLQNAPTS